MDKDLYESICRARGKIIELAVEIEYFFHIHISEYFTKDEQKQQELVAVILSPRLTFKQEFEVFMYLIKKYNPDFLERYPDFKSDVDYAMEERNMFAHWPAIYTDEAIHNFNKTNLIAFVKIKNYTMKGNNKKEHLVHSQVIDEAYYANLTAKMAKILLALKGLIS